MTKRLSSKQSLNKKNIGFEPNRLQARSINQAITALRHFAKREITRNRGTIVKTYEYTDEKGELLFQVIRFVPKRFVARRPDGKGGWINSLHDGRLVLYNLPEVIKSPKVIVVEGEKDADSLRELGYVATTNAGGVGPVKWKAEYSEFLKGKEVLIIPDNDLPGKKHALIVAKSLDKIAKSVRILYLPDIAHRGDVSDWIETQRKIDKTASLIKHKLNKLIAEKSLSAKEALKKESFEIPLEVRLARSEKFQQGVKLPGLIIPPVIPAKMPLRFFKPQLGTNDELSYRPVTPNSSPHLRLPVTLGSPTTIINRGNQRPEEQANRGFSGSSTLTDKLEYMLNHPNGELSALSLSPKALPQSDYHDFANHVFMLRPFGDVIPDEFDATGVSPGELKLLTEFLMNAYKVINDCVVEHFTSDASIPSRYYPVRQGDRNQHITRILYQQFFLPFTAPDFYQFYRSLRQEFHNAILVGYFGDWLSERIIDFCKIVDLYFDDPGVLFDETLWRNATKFIIEKFLKTNPSPYSDDLADPETYPFMPYAEGSTNFGLSIVYRQSWTSLGLQCGDIVKAIPLGPKQIEKVSTKIARHRKISRNRESIIETQRDHESTETNKDSSDIVNEAAESSKFQIEASAGYEGFGFSANVKTGYETNSSSSSKDAKSHLSEAVQKTASKVRQETKVTVSTESEETYEENRASEIMNPNEELAITYVYKKLSRQYEVKTFMAEVNSVVFVAECVPDPSEVTADWIRRHDYIISRVLLDPSLASDLALIRNPMPEEESNLDSVIDGKISTIIDKVTTSIPEYKTAQGSTLPDIFSTPQQIYVKEIEQKRERVRTDFQRKILEQRLCQHIKDNILHYCRAIWNAEDPDARLQRYSRIRVPVRWRPVVKDESGEGYFEVDVKDSIRDIRPLSDIINPAGPIGFASNYAIYYLKNDSNLANLNEALSLLRADYVKYSIDIENKTLLPAPSNLLLTEVLISKPTAKEYEVDFHKNINNGEEIFIVKLKETPPIQGSVNLPIQCSVNKDRLLASPLDFPDMGISLRFGSDYEDASLPSFALWTITISSTEFLEDPELRQLKIEIPLPPRSKEEGFFTEEVLADIADYLPDFTRYLTSTNDKPIKWGDLSSEAKGFVHSHYHEYVLTKRYTRRFMVDTNNLLVDLEVGETSALEDFKRLHRYVDVLKAIEEKEKMRLENQRREKLLASEKLGDPEIEKVTIISSPHELEETVNIGLED